MAQLGRLGFLGIAVVFHLIYIYSIFDIYFVSPIVHGMKAYSSGSEAPAKRLFLIVGDGLRADKCFQSHIDPDTGVNRHLAPFIRSRVQNEGTFGVSHTRVPTESRPGHVAMIAGLYEDVSAVATGWKLNPVGFDSVFNRSRHTWSWGSPDILPMFAQGAVPGRVDAYTYGEEMEDFSGDATVLDTWVFERVEKFFENAAKNETMKAMLQQDKLVFFLHLLGLDTTGHGFRPYSNEYLRNIKIVDAGVERLQKIVDKFYENDGKTSWVFTADHGMSDWGSHGDGHPDNTRTPLVVWGAGVNKPVKGRWVKGHEDGFSKDWNLRNIQRVDVAQADVAALMTYLVGLEFPVNSVGELPLDYINAPKSVKAKALYANAREILEQYRVKEARKKETELRFRPFEPLSSSKGALEVRFAEVEKLLANGSYDLAITKCVEIIKLGLDGLRYFQTYDWLFLRTLVTAGYLGWIAYALTTVVDLHILHSETKPARTNAATSFFVSILVALYGVLWVQKSAPTYYAYAFFPVFFWEEVFARKSTLKAGAKVLFSGKNAEASTGKLLFNTAAGLLMMESIVYGYFHREVFTCWFLVAIFWPFFYGPEFVRANGKAIALWTGCCALMSIFTLLPVIMVESITQILFGGFLMGFLGIVYLLRPESAAESLFSRNVMGIQIGLIFLSMLVTQSSVQSIQSKQGLPLGNQIVGWGILVLSLTVPFLYRFDSKKTTTSLHRLVTIFLTFSPVFIIFTISYEGIFYVLFSITLLTWITLEHGLHTHTSPPLPSGTHRPLTLSDTRLALFFFFFIQVAFFGTGNIASISSFSLESVMRLIPIFSPFAMGAVLIFKILIPFCIISAMLGILNSRIGVAPSALFMLVMAGCDVLTLNFFYMVRDEGSWLDIGTTISHFVIASLLFVFVAGLEGLSGLFVAGVVDDVVERKAVGEEKGGLGKVMEEEEPVEGK